jgi:hypothetical protein
MMVTDSIDSPPFDPDQMHSLDKKGLGTDPVAGAIQIE